MTESTGPLAGLRVLELVGQGPGPFGAMILADLGADVVSIDRPDVAARVDTSRRATNPLTRGKRSIALDLKRASDTDTFMSLVEHADVVVDPFRPGVCERLGIGPEELMKRNPRLIHARMTGWGQTGPLAQTAGHDIDYIALSGALHLFGYENQPPTMPINLLGDFAGGGLVLALGVASAVVERTRSGRGQVIDVAMVDGAAMILGPFFAAAASGFWGPRGTNHLDGGSHYYNVYRTLDDRWVAIGAIEPQFYRELVERLGVVDDPVLTPDKQNDRAQWQIAKIRMGDVFATKTRDEWDEIFAGSDACYAPVLAPTEVASHPHTSAREVVLEINGVAQAAPAPRFSRTHARAGSPCHPGEHSAQSVLLHWADVDASATDRGTVDEE